MAVILEIAENGVARVDAASGEEAVSLLNDVHPLPDDWQWKSDGADQSGTQWAHTCPFETCNHGGD